jgi:hypothetical protein
MCDKSSHPLLTFTLHLNHNLRARVDRTMQMDVSKQDRLAEIDARISSLGRQLLLAKRERNCLSPLCQLPAETLTQIMLEVHLQTTTKNLAVSKQDYKQRLLVMMVCHHLRAIVLQAGELWVYLDNATMCNYEWANLCIARAHDLPLEIRVTPHDIPVSSRIIVEDHFGRARSARIMDHKRVAIPLMRAFNRTAPYLEVLEYTGSRRAHVTSNFLGGASHTLKSLKLERITISGCPYLPAVTEMKLNFCTSDLAALAGWITGATSLQYLKLSQIFDVAERELLHVNLEDAHLPKIIASCLQRLDLDLPLTTCVAFLRMLPLPQAEMTIKVVPSNDDETWLLPAPEPLHEEILKRVTEFWKGATGSDNLPAWKYTQVNHKHSRFWCFETESPHSSTDTSIGHKVYIRLPHHPFTSEASSHPVIRSVQSVDIYSSWLSTHHMNRDIVDRLKLFPALQHLELHGLLGDEGEWQLKALQDVKLYIQDRANARGAPMWITYHGSSGWIQDWIDGLLMKGIAA